MQLYCDEEAMVLTLNTLEPFEGRIYSKADNPPPGDCEISGKGDRSTTLAMSLRNRRCGLEQEVRWNLPIMMIIVLINCHFSFIDLTLGEWTFYIDHRHSTSSSHSTERRSSHQIIL